MMFLYTHLKSGSFVSSYADTDSMCLGLSRTKPIPENASLEEYYRCLFDPLVKPEMLDSWEAKWKQWFCTTEAVEDQRKPGKFKSKFIYYFIKNLSFRGVLPIKGALYRLEPQVLLHMGRRNTGNQKKLKRRAAFVSTRAPTLQEQTLWTRRTLLNNTITSSGQQRDESNTSTAFLTLRLIL